jgi:hypothetical protein
VDVGFGKMPLQFYAHYWFIEKSADGTVTYVPKVNMAITHENGAGHYDYHADVAPLIEHITSDSEWNTPSKLGGHMSTLKQFTTQKMCAALGPMPFGAVGFTMDLIPDPVVYEQQQKQQQVSTMLTPPTTSKQPEENQWTMKRYETEWHEEH